MSNLRETLCDLIVKLSEKNYDESFAQYRFWLDIGGAHGHITPHDQVYDDTWRIARPDSLNELIHPTAHLLIRFIGDVEADPKISRYASGIHKRRSTSASYSFFEENLSLARSWNYSGNPTSFLTNTNFVARWANLGYVEEKTIRNQILQSLISHPKLYNHQADALIILFKLAGATFAAYVDSSVVDRCFELLNRHYSRDSAKGKLVQELVELRERGWEGLPLPPALNTTGKSKPTGTDQKDPAATPVFTSLGLPSRDLDPQIRQHPLFESAITPETDTTPGSPTPQSPSISIATLSDFTIADASDDEPPIDPTAATPHDTFYLEDGNVEVLCGNTLFRVHTSVLSFHSPVLGQMLAKASLAIAESPNGCPRILSSDIATDFVTLLKIVYLPEFPERGVVPNFTTFSSLLQITAKYEMPTVRSRILDVIRDAYPEAFEGLAPSKSVGESVFSGSAPHPNAVLNLFVQQKLISALPMAYYMAVRRGLDSLMDRRLPANARLPPETLQVAIRGLIALREMELKETHRLILGSKASQPCSWSNCPSRNTTGPRVSEAHQTIVDWITDSTRSGTGLLQVLSLKAVCGFGFCDSCLEAWEAGHADVRKNAWAALPGVFGLKG